MAYVRPHRNAAGSAVSGVFDRVTTEGDATRFNNADVGYSALFNWDEEVGGSDSDFTWKDLTLRDDTGGFDYIVGAKQLIVSVCPFGSPPVWHKAIRIDDWRTMAATTNGTQFAFEELSSSTVRVYNVSNYDAPSYVLVEVPHTSLPASTREKVIVKDQGDNEAVELLGRGDGVAMHSPNGTKWLVRVDDSGALVVEPRG